MEGNEKGFIEELVKNAKEIRREFGSFIAYFDEEANLVVESASFWKTVYPFGTDAWTFLSYWVETWDDSSRECIENFIKLVVFPTSMRVSDIDTEYIKDIANAHVSLNNRVESESTSEEENDEKDNSVD